MIGLVLLIGCPRGMVGVEGGQDVTYQGALYAVRSDWRFGELLFTGIMTTLVAQ